MCSPDTIDLIPYDGGKNNKEVKTLQGKLEKRKEEIQKALEKIKNKFKLE
jgi:hypothetical protein